LWLRDIDDKTINELPLVSERVENVKSFRLKSPKAATREDAKRAKEFSEIRQPDSNYIVIPRHSSERRKYIPFGFVSKDIVVNDAVSIVPNANLYHFGILMSQFHNAWMRVVAGRLKSDYRYSNKIVYNNFVWPGAVEHPSVPVEEAVSEEVRTKVESCAQAILDARDAHPDSSLADLYDPDKMPDDLRAAHNALDKAVEEAYGVDFNGDEEKIVAHLFKLYAEMTKE
ncbi:MAG: type IIL restriction-modification enzyme MmeI, partial [Eggerthellaceae bacterium]|nr:type IIL restriction-modification enzyme MmeI [Eggerthellaceae bacterium]